MKFLIFAAVFLLDREAFLAHGSHDWSYWGENGPEHWPGICNTGENQSPIDIITDDAVKTDLGSLKFTRYDFAFSADVVNTGHSIQVGMTGVPIHLKGGSLPTTYVLDQMHFHWGSEHTINGEQEALELHLVHYSKDYDNVTYASEFENGLAVVAVLFEISNEDNLYIEQILEAVKAVSSGNSTTATTKLQTKLIPSLLLPKDHSTYYRYYGSLTTPECQEAAIWTVLDNKMPISVSQIEVFRKVVNSNNERLAYNNRPTQVLGSRTVYHHLEGYSSAHNLRISKTLVVIVGFLSILMQGARSP